MVRSTALVYLLFRWLHTVIAHLLVIVRRLLRKVFKVCGWALPPRPDDPIVSPKWLQKVLSSQGVLKDGSQRVVAVKHAGLSENRGMVGAMTRIIVTYEGKDNSMLHFLCLLSLLLLFSYLFLSFYGYLFIYYNLFCFVLFCCVVLFCFVLFCFIFLP